MELITILNRCHRFRGFVYSSFVWAPGAPQANMSRNTLRVMFSKDAFQSHLFRRIYVTQSGSFALGIVSFSMASFSSCTRIGFEI
jgi:hypothetical protein